MNINTPETVVSKKYAHAFLNTTTSSITYDDIKKIESLGLAMQKVSALMALFKFPMGNDHHNPVITHIKSLCFPNSMHTLIDLLAEKQRLFLLPTICRWIAFYFRERHTIVQFLITSSQELSVQDKEKINNFLQRKIKATVETSHMIDYALIAGLRMQSKTYLWEKSIAQQLRDVQLKFMR